MNNKEEHDKEILLDDMEQRIETLSRTLNTVIILNDLKVTEELDYVE